MPLIVGEFDLSIDGKNRLAIPAAVRDQIDPETDGRDFYLVLAPDLHLCLYPDAYYRTLLGQRQGNPFLRKGQKVSLYFPFARVVKPDGQGRFVLPPKSMQRAVMAKKVTLIGNGDHIAIWPTEEWAAYDESEWPHYGERPPDGGGGNGSPSEEKPEQKK